MNRLSWFSSASTFCLAALVAGLAIGQEPRAVRSVADFARVASATAGIQEAIDSLPREGGEVVIPPGRFVLRQSVVLRCHVRLRGSGPATILTRGKQAAARLTKAATKGERAVEIESTEGFRTGDELAIVDRQMGGWYAAHPVVQEVHPRRLVLAGPIESGHAEGIFATERNAAVVNYFPAIRGNRAPGGTAVVDIQVADLAIDGNLKENPGPWSDFTLAAIHLAGVSDALVRNCTIHGWISDGIGVQGGRDNRVESCLVENCRGPGFHPGTSLSGAVFSGNISRYNRGDGLYFCCAVTGITVTNNLFFGNTGHGVGGLGEGCGTFDQLNVVSNNVLRENGLAAIRAIGGKNNIISGNACFDNSAKEPGRCSAIELVDTIHTVVTGNRCGSSSDTHTHRFGIEERGRSDANVIVGNLCEGNREAGIVQVGQTTTVSGNIGNVRKSQ